MAYGDIISNIHTNKSQYRESNGVETVHAAVVLRDSNTKGSPAINHLSNHLNLDKLTAVKASNRAGDSDAWSNTNKGFIGDLDGAAFTQAADTDKIYDNGKLMI